MSLKCPSCHGDLDTEETKWGRRPWCPKCQVIVSFRDREAMVAKVASEPVDSVGVDVKHVRRETVAFDLDAATLALKRTLEQRPLDPGDRYALHILIQKVT